MRAGIFAAGEGSRLAAAFPGVPKPMVPVAGRPLIHWSAAALKAAGARSLTVLLNSRGGGAKDYLAARFQDLELDFVTADTASSWESFRLLSLRLAQAGESFLLGTVDALILPAEAARFAREASRPGADGALALTRFVDDEKPLWARLGPDGRIAALGEPAKDGGLVTCGLYRLTPGLARSMPEAGAHASLRGWWTEVVSGRRILGIPLSKTLDIDRPQDLAAAEAFLADAGITAGRCAS